MRAFTHNHQGHLALCLVLFFFLFAGEAAATDNISEKVSSDSNEYFIGLGDVLEVQVWREPELTKELTVRLDGRISLPLVDDIMAAGKSPETLARDIEEKLKTYLAEPSVTVILQQSISHRYYIVGKIVKPGEFYIDSPLTILQVIARSGGFQEWAKKDKIMIIRRQSESSHEKFLSFDYEALVEKQDISQNIEIAPGDTVIVP